MVAGNKSGRVTFTLDVKVTQPLLPTSDAACESLRDRGLIRADGLVDDDLESVVPRA